MKIDIIIKYDVLFSEIFVPHFFNNIDSVLKNRYIENMLS